ncbi:hypothetical protein KXD40_006047 [Peronospora effusa]|uniref:Uncharacterized protein n=1 Tax=Peronospora effusa TaxID=542832 RepID=A0A3M6V9S8_9STRA|nr:hypothetical protein DD238_007387 [Peronospora effusa]RQM15416.1 hypothetical protein DD237_004062 [Peronospora effusa]UIZ25588.1 hypothetical protein KXD40_006047 [Peronospora effusa]CAI5706934.1 unnamed protein product [Peronospora effusa]
MTSKGLESMLGKNVREALKYLQLHKGIPSHDERYDACISYLKITPLTTLIAKLKVSKRHGEKSILKTKLEDALLQIWKDRNLRLREIIKPLELDKPADRKLYIRLVEMWVKYSKSVNSNMTFVLVFTRDNNTRMRILDGLNEIEGTKEVVKSVQDHLIRSWVREKRSAKNVFVKLKLFEEGHSDFDFDMWAKYVAHAFYMLRDRKLVITKLSGRYGDEGLLKMLDALEKKHVGQDIQGELKSALMTSWEDQNKSADDVFKLLKLDVIPEPNYSINVKRLSLWVKYMEENVPMPETRMTEVIGHYDLDVALMVYDGLRETRHIYAAKILQNSLVDRLQHLEGGFQDQVVQVFKILKLDNGLDKLLDKSNLDLFYRYADKYEPEWTKEASLITAARTVYGDIPLGKMLLAARENDATLKPFILELFKQWKKRHQELVNQLEGDPDADVIAFLLAFSRAG